MKHPLNGQRASEWQAKHAIACIVKLPINGWFPPLKPNPHAPMESQMVRPLQQVTLRPDMLSDEGYLRLGNTPGDEANCWIHPETIEIVEVLGRAFWEGGKLEVQDALERSELRAAA